MGLKAIVIKTAGTNCDYESVHALKYVGFEVDLVHINELIRKEKKVSDYNFVMFPGGFADGDYLGASKVLTNKVLYRLNNDLPEFVSNGGLVLGVCNGFQLLLKTGLLPGFEGNYKEQKATLTFNPSGHLIDTWINLKSANSKSIFTKGIESIYCPLASGENRFYVSDKKVLEKLYENKQVAFKYENDPTGSMDSIAGICDESGRVLGVMPHPERNFYSLNDPRSTRIKLPKEGEGVQLFRNAFEYFKK